MISNDVHKYVNFNVNWETITDNYYKLNCHYVKLHDSFLFIIIAVTAI